MTSPNESQLHNNSFGTTYYFILIAKCQFSQSIPNSKEKNAILTLFSFGYGPYHLSLGSASICTTENYKSKILDRIFGQ